MAKGASALPGFRDFYPEEYAARAFILNTWREVARRFGFVEYDGPPLESLAILVRTYLPEALASRIRYD